MFKFAQIFKLIISHFYEKIKRFNIYNLHYEKFPDGSVKCIQEEIPFELPNGWEWARLSSISKTIFAGGDKPNIYSKIKSSECNVPIYANGIENNGLYGYTDKAKVIESSITVSARGTIGFCCVRNEPFVPIVRLLTITPCTKVDLEYLNTVFNKLLAVGTGSCILQLTVPMIISKLIPIPPQEEQKRIVNTLSKYCDIIQTLETNTADIKDTITAAKSKILDLAIRGKLVPQDPNDEPASVLLERIRAEKEELTKQGKIKRDKRDSVIFRGDDNSYYEKIGNNICCIDEEIPFSIPDSWVWCRGFQCFSGMKSQKPSGDYFDYIDIDSIDNKRHCVKSTKRISVNNAPSRASRAVLNGSVLFSMVRPYLQNIAYVNENLCNSIVSSGFYVCNSNGILYPEYMYYLMLSSYVITGLNNFMKGDNSPSINKDDIENWLYPIPPLQEQYTIVQKIKEFSAEIDMIDMMLY